MLVKINKWDNYNQRNKDYKKAWWFSLSNTILEDPDMYILSAEELKAWIYVLCQASRKKSNEIWVEKIHAERACNVKWSSFLSMIDTLSKKSIISTSCQDLASNRPASGQHRTEQNNTEQNNNYFCSELENPFRTLEEFTKFKKLLVKVKKEVQEGWIKAYQDAEWLKMELGKAEVWLSANPKKKPKGDGSRFLTNWLARGWESYRKTIQTNKPSESLAEYRKRLGISDGD